MIGLALGAGVLVGILLSIAFVAWVLRGLSMHNFMRW